MRIRPSGETADAAAISNHNLASPDSPGLVECVGCSPNAPLSGDC